MKGVQFQLIANSATTGHKLQGSTMEHIFVNELNNTRNWQYVVLSRVKTMAGLYLNQRLKNDLNKYKKPEEMLRMIADFAASINYQSLTPIEYQELTESTNFQNPLLRVAAVNVNTTTIAENDMVDLNYW